MKKLTAALILMGALDCVSTWMAITLAGASELNPLMATAMSELTLTGFCVLKMSLTVGAAAWLYLRNCRFTAGLCCCIMVLLLSQHAYEWADALLF